MIEARRSGLSCSNFPPRAFGNTEGFRVHATLCRSCFELRISDFEFSLRSGCHATLAPWPAIPRILKTRAVISGAGMTQNQGGAV